MADTVTVLSRARVVCASCSVADTLWTRLRGLMGRRELAPGEGLLVTGFGLDRAHLPPGCPVTTLEEYDAPDLDWNSLAGLGKLLGRQAVDLVPAVGDEVEHEAQLAELFREPPHFLVAHARRVPVERG